MTTTVAEIILQQIREIDYWALGSYGAHSIDKTKDALYFRVRGTKFSGKIGILYQHKSDTYIVRSHHDDGAVMKDCEGVHAEELVSVLDCMIG